jgi:hypothetical protein
LELAAALATGAAARPEDRFAAGFGACFACPEKLYRFAALAAGLRLALSEVVRFPTAGRAPGRAVAPALGFRAPGFAVAL